jgi:hypothetical protein
MIAVNALTPLQYAPRQAEQTPVTVNPPASFETDAPMPTAQDTGEFSQTEAPASETPEGTTPPAEQTTAEAPPPKKEAWYKKGFVAPAILGSVATGIGALVAGLGNEGGAFRATLGAGIAASLALFGASVLARGNKKADVPTPPVEAPASTPVETPPEAKPVA